MADLHVFPSRAALADAAASRIAEALGEAIDDRGKASLVLAGGSTPEPVYRRLAMTHADALDWSAVHVFWGDERCVPPDHPDSNYRMARKAFLDTLDIPETRIHRMRCERGVEDAVDAYATVLRTFFEDADALFDVTLLGLGEDGHTASLFPDSPLVDTPSGWVAHTEAPASSPVTERLTLTLPALNASRVVLFLVSGEGKREVLHAILHPTQNGLFPAARVRPVGSLEWFVDEAAHGGPTSDD
jgi:6-phosphogluconolactonase